MDHIEAEEPKAWLVRGAKNPRYDQWMITEGYAGVDFRDVPSLSAAPTLEEMRTLLRPVMPEKSDGAIGNYAAQLNAFANRIAVGDIVILPMKERSQLAFGVVTGGYEYQPETQGLVHRRAVQWRRTDVPRTAINQDLLYSLGAFSTVVQIKRNDAAYRFRQVMEGAAQDPGARSNVELNLPAPDDVVDSDEAIASGGQDIIRYSRDRILSRLKERFKAYDLEYLIAELLKAEGMTCKVMPEGTDGGVDIIAGSGVLGISAPTIIVQVKSQSSPVGSETLDQLGGVVSQHNADHGLLVAMGGLTSPALRKVEAQQLRVAVWDSEEVIDRLLKHYEQLPDVIRDEIPLRRAWVIDEDEESSG